MDFLYLLFLVCGTFTCLPEALGQPLSNNLDDSETGFPLAATAFICPTMFGSFPDPDDCAYYYLCMGGIPYRMRCKRMMSFDVVLRKCMPSFIAVCEKDRDKSTASTVPVTKPDDINFVCSSFYGSYPHPKDCSKYFTCFMYQPTLKTCPRNELFDAVKNKCRSEKHVNCGTRQRPGVTTPMPEITTTPPTDDTPTVVPEITTHPTDDTTTKYVTDTTTEYVTDTTTEYVTDTPTSTPEIQKERITTTEVQPTGPQDHNCDEDDLDCIITETGDVNKWFKCPQDMGGYPHPSSDKLFIFCKNGKPSVKKCGLDRVFSKELSTCVEISYY